MCFLPLTLSTTASLALTTNVSDYLVGVVCEQLVDNTWQPLGFDHVHHTTCRLTGLYNRFHQSMKAALRATLTDGNWLDCLPWAMLGLRSAPEEDLQCLAAELVLGQPL